jgi:hypothetical protein
MQTSSSKHSTAARLLFVGVVIAMAACGPKVNPAPVGNTAAVAAPARSPLEERQAKGCAAVAPTLTACAIADAKANMTPEKFAELQADKLAAKHTSEFIKSCTKVAYSSRQVRVLEVCQREETECDPLIACLSNLDAQQPASK